MEGIGRIDASGVRYEFAFHIKERATGFEQRGRLELEVRRVGRETRANHMGTFLSTDVDSVIFSDDPRIKPSTGRKPTIDTALISGLGRWDGAAGYTFTAQAVDAGEPGVGRDSFTISIRDPSGALVTTVSGKIAAGNIQSNRLR